MGRGRGSRRRAALRPGAARRPGPGPAAGVRDRPELPRPRGRVRLRGAASQPSVFTKFAELPHRARTPRWRCRPAGTPTGRSSWSRSSARRAWQVAEADAWSHVAGLTVGQDISERILQLAGPPPQFSLGKSFPGLRARPGRGWSRPTSSPTLTTSSSAARSTASRCRRRRTSNLIFSVPELIATLSADRCRCCPATSSSPAPRPGVGLGRDPQRWLAPGDELVSYIDGIGETAAALRRLAWLDQPLRSAGRRRSRARRWSRPATAATTATARRG